MPISSTHSQVLPTRRPATDIDYLKQNLIFLHSIIRVSVFTKKQTVICTGTCVWAYRHSACILYHWDCEFNQAVNNSTHQDSFIYQFSLLQTHAVCLSVCLSIPMCLSCINAHPHQLEQQAPTHRNNKEYKSTSKSMKWKLVHFCCPTVMYRTCMNLQW